jgi:hypothetical protein
MRHLWSHQVAVLTFMGLVTAYLLARTFSGLAGGLGEIPEAVVYGGCAALGLEFLSTVWTRLWDPAPGANEPGR